MKKVLSFITALSIIGAGTINSLAAGIENIEYSDTADGRIVTVSGSAKTDGDVSFRVYNKGKTKIDLKSEPVKNVLYYGAQIKTDDGGRFTAKFPIKGTEEAEGTYNIEINFSGAEESDTLVKSIVYLPDVKAKTFVDKLNSMLKSSGEVSDEELAEFKGLIVDYIDKGYIVNELYNEMIKNGEDTDHVFKIMMYDDKYNDISDVTLSYNRAYNIGKSENAENIGELLKNDSEYVKQLGLDGTEALKVYLDEKFVFDRAEADKVLKNPETGNAAKMKAAFENKVVSLAVGAQTKYTIMEILKNLNSYIELNFDKYDSMTSKQQAFREYLSERMPKTPTIEQIKQLYEATVTNVLNKSIVTPIGGGGGTRGGSSPNGTPSSALQVSKGNQTQNTRTCKFKDLSKVPWAKDAIVSLYEGGYVDGVDEETFVPNRIVKREEFIKMLVAALKLKGTADENKFKDVQSGAWYEQYVLTAVKNGLINGINAETFGIGNEMTREDMAVILYRAVKDKNIETGDVSFTDKDEISSYALEAAAAMEKSGIISGVDDGKFAPKAAVTRAQTAVCIYRLLDFIK